jgi:hypothetical protein
MALSNSMVLLTPNPPFLNGAGSRGADPAALSDRSSISAGRPLAHPPNGLDPGTILASSPKAVCAFLRGCARIRVAGGHTIVCGVIEGTRSA